MSFARHPLSYVLAATVMLGGCEGGGITGTGADPTPVSVGVITNFGSVYVNGIKFETTNSKFKLDDAEGLEGDLKIGMVVSVAGSINADGASGTATQITFEDDVEGIVLNNDISASNTLNILGQTIHVDADTTFESKISAVTTIEQVVAGNIVEVSGHNSGDGNIYATRIEVKKASYSVGEDIEVTGAVKSVTETTFKIGSLTVDYSGAEFDGIPNNTIADGLFVEVKSKQGFNGLSELIADKVELEGDGTKKFEVEKGKELELEGVISQLDSDAGTFILNGQLVQISNSTLSQFENGQKVKVDGYIDDNGNLVVSETEVETKSESTIRAAGFVESVNTSANTLVLFGQTVQLGTMTSMNDERDEGRVRQFTINNIQQGDFLEVSAYRGDNNVWQATKLERDNPEDNNEVELRGIIDSVTNTTIVVVAGVNVDISRTEKTVAVGQSIEIKGSYSSVSATLDAIELSTSGSDGSDGSSKPNRDDD